MGVSSWWERKTKEANQSDPEAKNAFLALFSLTTSASLGSETTLSPHKASYHYGLKRDHGVPLYWNLKLQEKAPGLAQKKRCSSSY